MGDAAFEDPRLAEIYDAVEGSRADLEVYVDLVEQLSARSVLDVGCGTGTFACMLAALSKQVIAVDPAAASLAVARRKPHGDEVRWMHAAAADVPPVAVDVVTITGNVAEVFLTDGSWRRVLAVARGALGPDGCLVFEVRRPERRAWEGWTREATRRRIPLGEERWVETWVEITAVELPLVSFRETFAFEPDDAVATSTSTLRFRERHEIEQDLDRAGFSVQHVRDAPDRPGLEHVFISKPA